MIAHWHCNQCHHEWDGDGLDDRCSWCDARGVILEIEDQPSLVDFVIPPRDVTFVVIDHEQWKDWP